MIYLKTFELYSTDTGNYIDYNVDDIVIPNSIMINPKIYTLKAGHKYKVLKIYKTPEDKFLKKDYSRVDVVDIETLEISRGWESTRFKSDIETEMDKFNL